jgi:hypothetical protein
MRTKKRSPIHQGKLPRREGRSQASAAKGEGERARDEKVLYLCVRLLIEGGFYNKLRVTVIIKYFLIFF